MSEATLRIFDETELRKFDGSDPSKPVYVAFKGKVYDATNNPLFTDGMHFEHFTGCDLTDYMADAPHGDEVMDHLPVIGLYKK